MRSCRARPEEDETASGAPQGRTRAASRRRAKSKDGARLARLAGVVVGAVVLGVGCAGGRSEPALEVWSGERAARPALPDDAERAAARLAALVLADRPDLAVHALGELRGEESARRADGRGATGLLDNSLDLIFAQGGQDAYTAHVEEMLERDDLDPVLRHRLENRLEDDPLLVAERSLAEDRRFKIGSILNRVIEPLGTLASGGAIDPVGGVRAAVSSLFLIGDLPDATTRERRALAEWEAYLARHPDSLDAGPLAERVEHYAAQRRGVEHDEALADARAALEAGSPEAALLRLDRADRLIPGDGDALALRKRAESSRNARENVTRATWRADEAVALSEERARLARATLVEPLPILAARAERLRAQAPAALDDELVLLASLDERERGEDAAFFDVLERLGTREPEESNMARHAQALLYSQSQNPYRYYRAARRADTWRRTGWVIFGKHGFGAHYERLPGWLDALASLPARGQALLSAPIRLLQYPGQRARFGGGVVLAGERYLHRYPDGSHAEDVHRHLESLCATRGDWSGALAHHEAQPTQDADRLRDYHERVAEMLLAAAEREPRVDVRVSMLREALRDHAGTPQADTARDELRELLSSASPQRIRVSREFLLEFPELWGPSGLGLNPELLDGDAANGELGEDGITLLGRSYVELELENHPPLVKQVPAERLGRFVAGVEDASYQRLAADEREQPDADPQRDLYFERVRLGLVERADFRPSARSTATYLGTSEKHGMYARDSILPVELVLRGSLETLSIAAFPRIRLPAEEPDAFLYE